MMVYGDATVHRTSNKTTHRAWGVPIRSKHESLKKKLVKPILEYVIIFGSIFNYGNDMCFILLGQMNHKHILHITNSGRYWMIDLLGHVILDMVKIPLFLLVVLCCR
ncbi:hypothetical protein ACJX0J_023191 [Zea mays]